MPNTSEQAVSLFHVSLHATLPWSCTHFGDRSEIEAFIKETGKWETVAEVRAIGDVDAEDVASVIVRAVNQMRNAEAV
ncbi:MAG: hypothetical protein ABTQ34_04520 [Bdellovibrionales bacterium]